MNREAFRKYLLAVLPEKVDGKQLAKLKDEKTRDEALKHFDEHLTQGGKAVAELQPGYFNSRWGSLGLTDKLATAEKEYKAVEKNLADATKALERAPKNIDGMAYVSLEVADGFRRLELIRFTDPPTKP